MTDRRVTIDDEGMAEVARNAALAVGYRPSTAEIVAAEITAGQLELVVRGEQL